MASNLSAAVKTCPLRAEAPVFVPRQRNEHMKACFKFNPQAAAYEPSKDQQTLDQLLGILTNTSMSERSDEPGETSSGRSQRPCSAASSSSGRTYSASIGCSSPGSSSVDNSTGTVGDESRHQGSPAQSPPQGVLHHHHIHHHSQVNHLLPRIEHAEFVGSVEHLEHASHTGHNQAGHFPPNRYMHVQRAGPTQYVPNHFYSTLRTPAPNYKPIPCEAYLLDHPLRDPRTGYWEVPAAQPIRYRYTEAELALFRSTHKQWKVANGIPLYDEAYSTSNGQSLSCFQHGTMAREYHARNTYEYHNLESIQKVYGSSEFWYGWY